eukprot:scaffold699_cov385-Prasinococcus_capsulatus_cf.AAC.35
MARVGPPRHSSLGREQGRLRRRGHRHRAQGNGGRWAPVGRDKRECCYVYTCMRAPHPLRIERTGGTVTWLSLSLPGGERLCAARALLTWALVLGNRPPLLREVYASVQSDWGQPLLLLLHHLPYLADNASRERARP